MLVPLSWLADYVSLPANPAELVERLTLAGLESSGVRVVGKAVPAGLRVKPEDAGFAWERDKIVVARVLKIEKHPDADKLKLVTVEYGAAGPKTVVTGAPNIAVGESGMKVILGLRGSRYYYADKDGKKAVFTLEPKVLRGVPNDAMCMSNYELGVAEDHDGIIILDESDPSPGTPVEDFLGEIVVELDILPNMARCLGLLGIAREVAALTGAIVMVPDVADVPATTKADARVTLEDVSLCPRYSATIIRNITVGPAPGWMRRRLNYAGMRPITNAVDITNYAMLETGQPLHAFDYDVLVKRAGGKPPTILVRRAVEGETLKTLDGVDRKLSAKDLLIADTAGPIALAGVMGGLDTEVTATTKNILLEAAAFDFVSVRRTARAFNLFSEASTRFSRGIHPDVAGYAAKRAAQLFVRHAGGTVAGVVDEYPAPPPPQVVELNRSEIHRLLGCKVPDEVVERVLTALQFNLSSTLWGWSVTVPPTRLDVQAGAADLIEELARVSGYDKLPERLQVGDLQPPAGNPPLAFEAAVQDALAAAGLQECVTYSLSSVAAEAKLGVTAHVALVNPISPERGVLRTTLLPELLEVVRRNLDANLGVAVFELGPVFLPKPGELPDEPRRLALVLCGRRLSAAWDDPQGVVPAGYDFYDLKGVLESLGATLHLPAMTARGVKTVPYLHPGKAAEFVSGEKSLGTFGELHPTAAAAFGLAERTVLVAELDLDAMQAAVPARVGYRPFSPFPAAKRDVAVIVPADTPADRVLAEASAAGGELLAVAELFDVYTGDRVPAGTKSLAVALTYQAADRTLSDKEIDKLHEKVEGRLRHVLKAQVRGKDAG